MTNAAKALFYVSYDVHYNEAANDEALTPNITMAGGFFMELQHHEISREAFEAAERTAAEKMVRPDLHLRAVMFTAINRLN